MTGKVPRILVFAGSARKASHNKKLAAAAASVAEGLGADVTLIDLADYPIPLYDGDLEEADGLPEHAQTLKRMFADHDGLFIAAPEYNASITPLLKNTIDWLSRSEPSDTGPMMAFRGKVAALGSTSPGRLGGLRGLVVVRMLLSGIGVHVVPDQVAVGAAGTAFAEDGSLTDEGAAKMLDATMGNLINTARRLSMS